MTQHNFDPPRRARNLTDEDIAEIVSHFQANHICRLSSVTPEDMGFLKDLLTVYKETRSEVIKWLVRGVVYGTMIIIAIVGYVKLHGKHP